MNFMRSRIFVLEILSLTIATVTQFAPSAMSQANGQGQWQTLSYTMPVNPIHAALLQTGKVLIVSGSGNVVANKNFQAAIWDPQIGTITKIAVGWDMFCNGMVVLPDGRPFVVGGTIQYDPFHGDMRTSAFDPSTDIFTDQQSMAHGRWYPTATVLGDGRVMVFSGVTESGSTNTAVEIYTVGSGWSSPISAPWTPPLYPRMHVLPNGNVFYSGSSTLSKIFNPTTTTWTTIANTQYAGTRKYGSSVLLPLTPANNYKPRIMIMGGGNPSTATTELIDLSAATPKWVYGPNMSAPRLEMNATILPSGEVLALGGSLNDEDATSAALNADLFDPNAVTFRPAGTEAYPRLYHSVSLLMPDATVWVAGGNPARGTYEPHMEIYSPPYLFNLDGSLATRPTITNVSSPVIGYGGAFTIQTPDAANISTVVLMRNGSATHAFDMDQRHVGLAFTTGAGVLNVAGPPNGNIAPPGYYMLFILNDAGVPSVASMVQISAAPTDTPPTGTITSPASDVTIASGQSVSYAGTGTSTQGSVTGYSWYFQGGTPNASNIANPGSVTYPAQGTYVTTLTVTDNSGVTDPHPPTRTITVVAPDFSVAVSPGSQLIAPGGSGTWVTSVTPKSGFTGNVNFTVTGLPSGATASFSPTSVTNSGSTTMTVSTSSSTPMGNYSLTVTAVSGTLIHSTTTVLIVGQSGGTTAINFGSGFSGTGMQLNGHATVNSSKLQLTDGGQYEDSSAFWTTPVNVQSFTNVFTFQLTNPVANGFTFTIQNVGILALGLTGSNLGYSGSTRSIGKSVAVKFDLYNSAGEGNNSTGLYTNGAVPTLPATTLGGGVNLHSGDILQVQMSYDGTTLTMTITDTAVPADTFTTSWPINIPATVGSNTAYVGFTGGTGAATATQSIVAWTYIASANPSSPPAATPVITPATGSFTSLQTVGITDSTSGASIFYTLDGSQPTTSSTPYTAPFNVSATTTVKAMATAINFSTSPTATSVITISSLSTAATPVITPATGSFTSLQTVGITDSTSGASIFYTLDGTQPTTSSTPYTAPFNVSTSTTVEAIATAANFSTSATAISVITIQSGPTQINFGTGFSGTGLRFNSRAKLNGSRLQLTDGGQYEDSSAFWTTPVNVQSFTNVFTFQLTNPVADGFTFTIQNVGILALGLTGSNLGYSGSTRSIGKSVAVKFDLYNSAGEGNNSTGLYTNGAVPTLPATTLGGGVNLHSGDILQVQMSYDGTTLTMTITDTAVPADTFTTSWPINIPAIVGSNTAYVGFTGGTGAASAIQEILTWTYGNP